MNADLRAVMDWMKGTDLVEISYRKGDKGFRLEAPGGESAPDAAALPTGRFHPVVSGGVGVLQWSEPGQARKSEEGAAVSEGDVLAVVVSGSGAGKPVKSPRAGRVAKVLAEAGQAVEYGQPLLLLEAR